MAAPRRNTAQRGRRLQRRAKGIAIEVVAFVVLTLLSPLVLAGAVAHYFLDEVKESPNLGWR